MSAQPLCHPPVPYVGWRAFGEPDSEIFFGRKAEIREIEECWAKERLTVLHGGAGVGKTSLLCAGVVPRLRLAGRHVLPAGHPAHRPAFPVAALPEHNPFSLALLSSWYDREPPIRVSGITVADFLRKHRRTDRFGQPLPILAAIDQAEWLLRGSAPHEHHRLRFLDELAAALAELPDLHLLLVVRDEELEAALAFADRLGEGAWPARALGPLDPVAAIEAVDGPLRRHGRGDERMARLLVDELRTVQMPGRSLTQTTAFVEPAVLQMVCAELWADLPDGTGLPAERLCAEVDRVLTEHCARRLAMIAADHSIRAGTLYSWFRTAFGGPRGHARDPGRAGGPAGSEPAAGGPVGPVGLVGPEPAAAGVTGAVLRAIEETHLVRVRVRDGRQRHELQHPRLAGPIGRLGDRAVPFQRPGPLEQMHQAELAFAGGDRRLARCHVESAARSCGTGNLRFRAETATFLGDIAHADGETAKAIERYREAAGMFEAVPDNAAVGWLLTAVGRLLLEDDAAGSVRELRAAAERLRHEPSIQIALGQALWQSGRTSAALAVLDSVLGHDGDLPEALRVRGEILADLGEAERALRDLRRIDHEVRPSTHAAWRLALELRRTDEESRDDLELALPRLSPPRGDDSGPVLLRVARVGQLRGESEIAADLARRAVAARRPPLPPQLRDAAERLLSVLEGT